MNPAFKYFKYEHLYFYDLIIIEAYLTLLRKRDDTGWCRAMAAQVSLYLRNGGY